MINEELFIAGGYERLSIIEGDDSTESLSIIHQKKIIEEFANANNIKLYDHYVDDGYSGGNFDRPGFKRLIKDLKRGLINCIITKDISRLGRDFIETGNYIYKYFPDNDIRYIAILDGFDSLKPNVSDDFIPFKAVINDMYLKDTSRKIKSVRHELMEQGFFVGSSVAYGYKRSREDSRRLVVDEYAASIVKRIFDMKLNGMTPNIIARELTNDGILTPSVYSGRNIKKTFTTNIWKAETIKQILANEIYIGKLIQGKYERVSLKSKKKKILPRSKWIIKANNHEPIIDKDIFDKVNCKNKMKLKDKTRFVKYVYLLKGLVICADCGKTMLVRRVKYRNKKNQNLIRNIYCCKTYATYRNNTCTMHYFREDKLNEIVLKEIRNIIVSFSNNINLEEEYEKILSNANILEKYKNDLDINESKLVDVDKALSELYKDKATNVITEEEFISIKENLVNDKLNIERIIKNLKIMIGNVNENIKDDKTRKKIIDNFLKAKNFTKQMINDLVDKITIDQNKNVKIYFKFSLHGEEK